MDHPEDFGGFAHDVPELIERRDMLAWLGGVSLAGLLAACGFNSDVATTAARETTSVPTTTPLTAAPPTSASTSEPSTTSPKGTVSTSSTAGPGAEIPDETAGPFPADGSNGPNILDNESVVRREITHSIGGSSGVADGVPLQIDLAVVDAATGEPFPEAAVYLWHCTADGRYSIYEIAEENYLRGVQVTDAAGKLSYTTIFPGCYPGRWPHAHFEVFASLANAADGVSPIKTSQLALPEADCAVVFADGRYGSSADNLSRLSLATDGVFRDGWTDQLAVVTGSMDAGFTATLLVRV